MSAICQVSAATARGNRTGAHVIPSSHCRRSGPGLVGRRPPEPGRLVVLDPDGAHLFCTNVRTKRSKRTKYSRTQAWPGKVCAISAISALIPRVRLRKGRKQVAFAPIDWRWFSPAAGRVQSGEDLKLSKTCPSSEDALGAPLFIAHTPALFVAPLVSEGMRSTQAFLGGRFAAARKEGFRCGAGQGRRCETALEDDFLISQ